MRTIHVISILAATAALGLAATLMAPSLSAAKFSTKQTPQDLERKSDERLVISRSKSMRWKPSVDCFFRGDYQGALNGFRALRDEGDREQGLKIAICLLRLGRPDDALRSFEKPKGMDAQDYNDWRAAFAIASNNEAILRDAVGRSAGLRALSQSSAHDLNLRTIGQPVVLTNVQFARELMEIACAFGAKYDYETMHLVAKEALRRGATDAASLSEYSAASLSNGDLLIALKLAKMAEARAKADGLRPAQDVVYNIQNLIVQYSKVRPIELEERRGHEMARKFNRRFWINDIVLDLPPQR